MDKQNKMWNQLYSDIGHQNKRCKCFEQLRNCTDHLDNSCNHLTLRNINSNDRYVN